MPKRLQRMMLELQQFNIDLVYVQGTNLKIADSLSRNYENLQSNKEEFCKTEIVA